MSINEEERKLEILKAEAAIRELAGRMAEASASTKQADRAAEILEAAASSLKELNGQFRALMADEKRARDEERQSLDRLERMADSLETNWEESMREQLDARFKDLPQDVLTITNKLSFLINQNEASVKIIQALQQRVEELSHELRIQAINSQERLSSLEQARPTGLSHRLRSALIGGGLGVIIVFMVIRLG